MAIITDFNYFDPKQELTVTYGDMPHWEQVGATYFITFRTADSLPQQAINLWRHERNDWLTRQTNDSSDVPWHEKLKRLPKPMRQRFNRIFHYKLEQKLDTGLGECLLAKKECATVVANSLTHFDDQRYHLGDFVVMPNHVHLLVCFFKDVRLRTQCYSWKHFMATKINKLLGKSGEFWQSESFDHLVRDLEHFRKFQRYIRENPIKAGLSKEKFIHYTID